MTKSRIARQNAPGTVVDLNTSLDAKPFAHINSLFEQINASEADGIGDPWLELEGLITDATIAEQVLDKTIQVLLDPTYQED